MQFADHKIMDLLQSKGNTPKFYLEEDWVMEETDSNSRHAKRTFICSVSPKRIKKTAKYFKSTFTTTTEQRVVSYISILEIRSIFNKDVLQHLNIKHHHPGNTTLKCSDIIQYTTRLNAFTRSCLFNASAVQSKFKAASSRLPFFAISQFLAPKKLFGEPTPIWVRC